MHLHKSACTCRTLTDHTTNEQFNDVHHAKHSTMVLLHKLMKRSIDAMSPEERARFKAEGVRQAGGAFTTTQQGGIHMPNEAQGLMMTMNSQGMGVKTKSEAGGGGIVAPSASITSVKVEGSDQSSVVGGQQHGQMGQMSSVKHEGVGVGDLGPSTSVTTPGGNLTGVGLAARAGPSPESAATTATTATTAQPQAHAAVPGGDAGGGGVPAANFRSEPQGQGGDGIVGAASWGDANSATPSIAGSNKSGNAMTGLSTPSPKGKGMVFGSGAGVGVPIAPEEMTAAKYKTYTDAIAMFEGRRSENLQAATAQVRTH